MTLAQQTDNAACLVNDYRKQTRDVAAKHAGVERFDFGDRCILTTEHYLGRILTRESDLSLNYNRLSPATQTTDAIIRSDRSTTELLESCCSKNSAIRAGINQEWTLDPGTIGRRNLANDNGPNHAVVKQRPFSIDAHRSELPCLLVCNERSRHCLRGVRHWLRR